MKLSETHFRQLGEYGFVVIEDALDEATLTKVTAALDAITAAVPHGRNDFEGSRTRRAYALLEKTRELDALVLHADVLALVDAHLEKALLSAALSVYIEPDESVQPWHCDGAFYKAARSHVPFGVSTVWAFDDFTEDNGATELVPGSHLQPRMFPLAGDSVFRACMKAGSVLVFFDTLLHRGGANRSSRVRRAVTIQYCQSWLRTIENMFLAVSPATASDLSPRLRQLLGYDIVAPFVGYVDGRHPERWLRSGAWSRW